MDYGFQPIKPRITPPLDDEFLSAMPANHAFKLQAAWLGVFDSQICDGKRYDVACIGRRKANAGYFESHRLDTARRLSPGMDLTPPIEDDRKPIKDFVQESIARFARAAADCIIRLC